MAAKTGSKNVYDSGAYTQAESIREDLADFVKQLIPKITPMYSMFGRAIAKQPKHEYQTDTLPAAAFTARADGIDWPSATMTNRSRIYNECMILMTPIQIDGSQEASTLAGVDSELAYQVARGFKIHARAWEQAILDGVRTSGANPSTARQMGGLRGGSDETAASAAPGLTTNSTNVGGSMDEDDVLDLWELVSRVSYGDPDHVFSNAGIKRLISNFAVATEFSERKLEGKKRTVTVDQYETDFGQVGIVYDRFVPRNELYLLTVGDFRIAYLRPTTIEVTANLGDFEKRVILTEATLEIRAETHSGRLYGVTNY